MTDETNNQSRREEKIERELERLAGLDLEEYGSERKPSAAKMNIPVGMLDNAVKAKRKELGSAGADDSIPDIKELAARLRALKPDAEDDEHLVINPDDEGRDVVAKLLHLYALYPTVSGARVVPIHRRAALSMVTLKAFEEAMAKHSFMAFVDGKLQLVNPVAWWKKSKTLHTVDGVQMRPDKERPLYDDGERTFVNSYNPPIHDAEGGSAAIGLEFMKQLVPDDEERFWFMRWLSYKYLHPYERGPGVVMVARDSYGTGRGMLNRFVSRIFGAQYVSEISHATLMGKDGQAHFNEWLSDNLMVIVNESSEVEIGSTRYRAKVNAYERLKELVNPGEGNAARIAHKYGLIGKEMVFASFIIATNHADAFPMPENDRRFYVITNGEPRGDAFWKKVSAWMSNPANVAAFVDALLKFSEFEFSPHEVPPMTVGKQAMSDMSKSDLDRGLEYALADMKHEVMTISQVIDAMETARKTYVLSYPSDGPSGSWKHTAKNMAERKLLRVGIRNRVNWLITVEERGEKLKLPVYTRTNELRKKWEARAGLREAVLSEGKATEPHDPKDNVANFQSARSKRK